MRTHLLIQYSGAVMEVHPRNPNPNASPNANPNPNPTLTRG